MPLRRKRFYRAKRTTRKRYSIPRIRRRKFSRRKSRKLINVFPNSCFRYLNYQEENTLDPSVGSYDSISYRANGMYDPRTATGGHQPLGYDQLVSSTNGPYNQWSVYSSTITVTPVVSAVVDAVPCYLAVFVNTSVSPPTFSSVDHFLETMKREGTKVHVVGSWFANTLAPPKVSLKWRFSKSFARSHPTDPEYTGYTTADPSIQAYFHVVAYCIQGNNPGPCYVKVDIGYKAKFFNPVKLPAS